MEIIPLQPKPPGLSREELKQELQEGYRTYLNTKLKYPKAQVCYYYLKGICGNKTCQFSHSPSDFNFTQYLKFIHDKDAYSKERQDLGQRPNYYRGFKNLNYQEGFDYQNNNKDKFAYIYSQEIGINDPRARGDIRRVMGKEIVFHFVTLLFNHFKVIESNKLQKYISDFGYPYNIKHGASCGLFFTKIIKDAKKVKKNYSIVYPDKEAVVSIYGDIVIKYSKDKKYDDVFPFTFTSISSVINKRIGDYEPSTYQFISKFIGNETEFCDLIYNELLKASANESFDMINNKNRNQVYTAQACDSEGKPMDKTHIISLFHNETCSKYGIIRIEEFANSIYLSNTLGNSANENNIKTGSQGKGSQFVRQIKYDLFKDKSLFYYDNTNTGYLFNYNYFTSFNKDEICNTTYYHTPCVDHTKPTLGNLETKISEITLINKPYPPLTPTILSGIPIYYINTIELLNHLNTLVINWTDISVDIEGYLRFQNTDINLIQICDDTMHGIYVIDIVALDKPFHHELQNTLRHVFENQAITKVFFDGRNDVLSGHRQFNICVCNFIDLSCLFSCLQSFKQQISEDVEMVTENQMNKGITLCHAYTSRSLNKVGNDYNDGITNPLKEKYHKLFGENPLEVFKTRPIKEEFLLYSALDVKDGWNTYKKMEGEMMKILCDYYEKEANEVQLNMQGIVMGISSGHLKYACDRIQKHAIDAQSRECE